MAENRARERDQLQEAERAAAHEWLRAAFKAPNDGSGEENYERAEAEALARVKRKRSRGDYEAEWEWAKIRVAEIGDPAKPFDEQDERVQGDARRVP